MSRGFHQFVALLIIAATVLSFLVAVVGVMSWAESKQCAARWPERKTEYGLLSGCMVASSTGEMVPERAIRGAD